MANRSPKPRSGSVQFRSRIAQLERKIQDLRDELELERQYHDGFLVSQRELEISRERYANLYDLAPVGYLTMDGRGIIKEANLTATRMLGKQRAAILGLPLQMFTAKADRRAVLSSLSALHRGGGGNC
jgi:PAS domain-containing protein